MQLQYNERLTLLSSTYVSCLQDLNRIHIHPNNFHKMRYISVSTLRNIIFRLGLDREYLGNMHQIVFFFTVTFFPKDSNWLYSGFVVAPVESKNVIVFCTPVSEKSVLNFT